MANMQLCFHVVSVGSRINYDDGMVPASPEIAAGQAARIAEELAQNGTRNHGLLACVVDDEGNEVARVPVVIHIGDP